MGRQGGAQMVTRRRHGAGREVWHIHVRLVHREIEGLRDPQRDPEGERGN